MSADTTADMSNAHDAVVAEAMRMISEVRHRCATIGLSPAEFAELLLPEALLAFMVSGMRQEQVEAAFARFAQNEIAAWFLQVKRTAGYCDCAREARTAHAADCASVIRA
jgi:hypothetical protein